MLVVKNPLPNAGDLRDTSSTPRSGRSPGGGIATHSSILAWRIPRTEKPGGLLSTASQRVGHNWNDLAHMHSVDWRSVSLPKSCVDTLMPSVQVSEDGIFGKLGLGEVMRVGLSWWELVALQEVTPESPTPFSLSHKEDLMWVHFTWQPPTSQEKRPQNKTHLWCLDLGFPSLQSCEK